MVNTQKTPNDANKKMAKSNEMRPLKKLPRPYRLEERKKK